MLKGELHALHRNAQLRPRFGSPTQALSRPIMVSWVPDTAHAALIAEVARVAKTTQASRPIVVDSMIEGDDTLAIPKL